MICVVGGGCTSLLINTGLAGDKRNEKLRSIRSKDRGAVEAFISRTTFIYFSLEVKKMKAYRRLLNALLGVNGCI